MRDDIPLPECIKWLRRYKAKPDQPPLFSVLIQQLGNFDANPDAMRPKIRETLDRIERQVRQGFALADVK